MPGRWCGRATRRTIDPATDRGKVDRSGERTTICARELVATRVLPHPGPCPVGWTVSGMTPPGNALIIA